MLAVMAITGRKQAASESDVYWEERRDFKDFGGMLKQALPQEDRDLVLVPKSKRENPVAQHWLFRKYEN